MREDCDEENTRNFFMFVKKKGKTQSDVTKQVSEEGFRVVVK